MVNTESKQIILSIMGLAVLIVAVVGVSYAVFTTTVSSSKENMLTTGTISVQFKDGTSSVALNEAIPMGDEQGKRLFGDNQFFDFTVASSISGVSTLSYEISAEKLSIQQDMLQDDNVKFYLQKKTETGYVETPITVIPQSFNPLTETTYLGSPSGSMLLYAGTFINSLESNEQYKDEFRLRMWVSDNTVLDSISRGFKIKLNVYAKAI